ncbi:hypothetical protein [Nocardioides acrostichi]|uniref:Uncharacterized protein n=1 Tax=Nocardioides acrostichi TaxID=2784339 RepID=A0A930UZP8_9ACTN|nr:hypothetical protein [Nocardioides acrostichi]MBF4161206.1 hypothetical protein [Nocardioides acrostichi]
MSWRGAVLGVTTVLAVAAVGAAVGYERSDDATTGRVWVTPSPVVAADPSYPRDKPVDVQDDPDYPTLEPDLKVERRTLGDAFAISLPLPRGWEVSPSSVSEFKIYPEQLQPDTLNTYFARIRFVDSDHRTTQSQVDSRLTALATASGISDLQTEASNGDSLVATYIADAHRRVEMDRFVTKPGSDEAYLSIAVIGREQDRDGLGWLLDTMVRGLDLDPS